MKSINDEIDKELLFMRVFDEKLFLIGLLYSYFIQTFPPKHIICVSKKDILNISSIKYRHDFIGISLANSSIIDLSKLVNLFKLSFMFININGTESISRHEPIEINIEGLSSLESMFLGLHTAEAYSFSMITNLNSLNSFSLKISGVIDESILTIFLDKLPNIEELCLYGNFSYFNLGHLVNLKSLVLNGTIKDDFNFELFKNLCYQLKKLRLSFRNDYESISAKLLDGHSFTNLLNFAVYSSDIRRLKKKFIDKFPALQSLEISNCKLEIIENDAFSSIKKLTSFYSMGNCLKTLEKRSFSSQLTNLEELYLRNNRIERIEWDMFSNMKNLRVLDLVANNFPKIDPQTLNRLKNLQELEL